MIKGLADRVFLKRIGEDSYDAEGLIIKHDTTVKMETHHKGVVISAGVGCTYTKDGEVVLYKAITGKEIDIDGQKLIMLREGELAAEIEGDEKLVQLA